MWGGPALDSEPHARLGERDDRSIIDPVAKLSIEHRRLAVDQSFFDVLYQAAMQWAWQRATVQVAAEHGLRCKEGEGHRDRPCACCVACL
jgi:hypothetical protein